MNANELADAMEIRASIRRKATSRKSVTEGANDRLADQLEQAANTLRQQQQLIEILNGRIERMIENQSHHEGIAHAGGFEQGYEAGRKMGMQQERALWELAASTQEIMKNE
jgi:hypothetical protein